MRPAHPVQDISHLARVEPALGEDEDRLRARRGCGDLALLLSRGGRGSAQDGW